MLYTPLFGLVSLIPHVDLINYRYFWNTLFVWRCYRNSHICANVRHLLLGTNLSWLQMIIYSKLKSPLSRHQYGIFGGESQKDGCFRRLIRPRQHEDDCKRKRYAFRPSVHTKTMKTLIVNVSIRKRSPKWINLKTPFMRLRVDGRKRIFS